MFEGIKRGLAIFGESVEILFKHEVFILPLLSVYLIYAPIVLYLYFFVDTSSMTSSEVLMLVFAVIYVFALLFTFSNVVMLELIQQLESGRKLSIGEAVLETIHKDIIGIIVISFLWAIVWFILTIIQAMIAAAKRKRRGVRISRAVTPQEAARVLSGTAGPFSWIGLGINMIKKVFRMFVYLILPAIAWEDKNVISALRRGFNVLSAHATEFMTAYATSSVATLIVFAPAIIVTLFVRSAPDFVWYLVILYTAMAWTFSMYIEQMAMALLFLWHKKWEEAQKREKRKMSIDEVPKPSLLDEIPDLVEGS